MRIVAVRYARITAVSVKSGSRLGEKYWHTTSKLCRITAVSVKSGSRLAEMYGDSNSMPESQQCRSNLDQDWLRGMGIVTVRLNRSSVGQIWIKTG